MKSFISFLKKEITEQLRTGKLVILALLFTVVGIMNPAIAKLTPFLLEMFSESLSEGGMTITLGTVTAMDSWVQFYKNIPMVLIAFVLIQSGIFTKEYSTGTLLLSLTKGLSRYKVVMAKGAVLYSLFSIFYWLCYGITYLYNAYFWDNSVAQNLHFSALCYWIFGLWIVSLMILLSTFLSSGAGVALGAFGITVFSYAFGLIPKIGKYFPTRLCDGNSLIYGTAEPRDYVAAVAVSIASGLACLVASIFVFNKKQL